MLAMVNSVKESMMNYYQHLQQVENVQNEAIRQHRNRQHRDILNAAKKNIKQLSLWKVIWAWFVARRQTTNYEDTYQLLIKILHPRKSNVVQSTHKSR